MYRPTSDYEADKLICEGLLSYFSIMKKKSFLSNIAQKIPPGVNI